MIKIRMLAATMAALVGFGGAAIAAEPMGSACLADVQALCAAPDGAARPFVGRCLRDHFDALSPACQAAIEQRHELHIGWRDGGPVGDRRGPGRPPLSSGGVNTAAP
jgi:hypothetical protein